MSDTRVPQLQRRHNNNTASPPIPYLQAVTLVQPLLQEQQDGRDMIPAGVGGPGKLFRAHSEHSLAGGEQNHGDRQTAGIASAKRKEMIHWCTHSKMHISRSVRCAACAGEEQR